MCVCVCVQTDPAKYEAEVTKEVRRSHACAPAGVKDTDQITGQISKYWSNTGTNQARARERLP